MHCHVTLERYKNNRIILNPSENHRNYDNLLSQRDRAGHWPKHKGVKAVMAGSQCLLPNDNSSNTEKPLSEAYTLAQASLVIWGRCQGVMAITTLHSGWRQLGGTSHAGGSGTGAGETRRDMMRRWEQWDIITRAVTRLCLPHELGIVS